MDPALAQRITDLVQQNKVVLFMKGSKSFPQCGFSARAVEIFKRCGVAFKDVNILSDAELRQGIKEFSNWPTIPQVYVDGKFVGGSDILLEMFESGELQKLLGVEAQVETVHAPKLTVTSRAAEQLRAAVADADEGEVVRFEVSGDFQYDLQIARRRETDLEVDAGALKLYVGRGSARRADGVRLDWVDGPDGVGFKIDNPNEPPGVKRITAQELEQALASSKELYLFDVRGEKEREAARIGAARPLDPAALDAIERLPKDAMIVLHCHHGVRSRTAAAQLCEKGYSNVHSLEGGIDAWSLHVDPSVPRY
jgi:monothiol glutaredoxin